MKMYALVNSNVSLLVPYNKCIILIQDINNRGNWVQDLRELFVLSSTFFCKSKSLLKNKLILKRIKNSIAI